MLISIPTVMLAAALAKDTSVIAVVRPHLDSQNKPYLGWKRHTWDPMLLGILLTGVVFSSDAGQRPGRNSPALPGRAPMRKGQTLDERRVGIGLLSPQQRQVRKQAVPTCHLSVGRWEDGGASGDF